MAEMLKDYDFDKDIRAQMEDGQRKMFEGAKEFLCEKFRVLHPEVVSKARCQQILFFPLSKTKP